MTDELVFYTHPMSRGRIVRWMLEEVGQPYRTELLDYGTTMKRPEYLAINPIGKVPALRHGETVVTETAAICAYLADVFPEAGLAPLHNSRLRGPITAGCSSPRVRLRLRSPTRCSASRSRPSVGPWRATARMGRCWTPLSKQSPGASTLSARVLRWRTCTSPHT